MDMNQLADGLIQYLILVALLTFHEFGHAWTAMKCGDDTAKMLGRVSLNPAVHIDPIGTVLLPMLQIFLPVFGGATGAKLSQFIIGWAKPVPVNVNNLRRKNFDDILVTMAGPGMNLVLAFVLVGMIKAGVLAGFSETVTDIFLRAAVLSLVLCFFNLIPVPPLDGSHIMRIFTGMSWEAYARFAQFGFIIVIIVLQVPAVRQLLGWATFGTLAFFAWIFRI